VTGFRGINSTGNTVLNLLETGYIKLREVVVKLFAVIRFEVNDKGARKYSASYRVASYSGNGAECCGIELGITFCLFSVQREFMQATTLHELKQTRMWANAQSDEHSWRPLFNSAKFG